MNTSRSKLDSVQVLRAIAVLLVVYVHTLYPSIKLFGPSRQSSFYYLAGWGAIGVDLFFVISGFIMTRIIHAYQGAGGWKLFALKRFLRIIPLYWGMSAVAALLILRTNSIRPIVYWKTLSFFPFTETEFILPIIPAGWTLSYEIYFYSLIALVLFFRVKNPQQVTLVLLTGLSAIGYFVDSAALLPRFLTSPLLLEFALGVGCGLVYDRFQTDNPWHRAGMVAAFFIGILFILAPVFWNYGNAIKAECVTASNQLSCWRSLIWGIPCALLLLGYTLLERVHAFTTPRLLTRLGDASYSNYLLHVPIIVYGYKTILKLHLSTDAYVVFQVGICTVVSLGLYQFVEKPLTDWLNRYFFPTADPVRSPSPSHLWLNFRYRQATRKRAAHEALYAGCLPEQDSHPSITPYAGENK